ncbi:unnamed protein product [Rhodiola kirilowii]
MHFLLTNLKVVYVLSTPCPEVGDDAPMVAFRDRNKWENDDYIARGHILNGMSDASSVKFLVSNFNNYKMVDSRPVMEQFHEIQRILGHFSQQNLKMDEAISVSSIIDKLPPAWKDFQRSLKHKKKEISLVELAKELRMEEELRMREKNKMEVDTNSPKVNVLETSSQKMNKNKGKKRPNEFARKGPNKKHPSKGNVCWTCRKAGHFKRDCRLGKGKSEKAQGNAFGNKNQEQKSKDDEISWWVDSGATAHVCRDKEMFKSFANTSEGRVLHMGHESTAHILGIGQVEIEFSSGKNIVLVKVLSKRARKEKSFGNEFHNYLVEGTRDEVSSQYMYCHVIESDLKTFDEAMKSQDVSFWKEAINDEMDSIIGNNTWILVDLPPAHKPLGNKWIFQKKMKVDGTIDKFKARLVIQGFRQKYGMHYFDTYAPVARISTIRLLIALASIHKLLVHQMDVKTAFLNGDLEKEIYMKQLEGFIMSGQEHKVCKLVKSLYGLKQASMQWHQKFDEVVLSDGFILNQSDKCVYSKFDNSGNGVIICLYVDDMLIFGTNLKCINQTKEFLSSKFSMKDMGEAEVILGIRIKRLEGGLALTQSHYIENVGKPQSQLEYAKVIGSLMYVMTCIRPDIAFAGTMNFGLVYSDFPSVIEGYLDASWISNKEDHSSTNGWVFLLGGGAISWASKKQTCISSSTMESEFVALVAASNAATLAKAYSHVYNGKSRHLGTFIDQGEKPEHYFDQFPEDNPVLGFITWRWILALGFDHMFTSPVFLGMLALLGASLMACTYTTQIPLVKVAKRWNFVQSAEAIRKQEYSDSLPKASIKDLGVILMGSGYEVYLKGPCLYAFKGLAGRFAPIGVHVAMLLIMGGATLSAAGSFKGSVTVPQGLNFVVGDVLGPTGFLSTPTDAFNTEVHVNKFSMDYYDSGEVSQFHSDISLNDINGKEVTRKTISVNDPLRYAGITIYQTDWSLSALQVLKDGEGPFNLAMAPLKVNGDKKLYGTFLPVGDTDSPNVKGISMLARDLQSIIIYDQEGKFVGVRRPSSKLPIDVGGTKLVILDAIGSTGLDLKTDPGVPVVYAGFGSLMLTTCISYLSHAQIWALQDGTTVVVGGKTNRAKYEFPEEMDELLDRVPEIVEASSPRTP